MLHSMLAPKAISVIHQTTVKGIYHQMLQCLVIRFCLHCQRQDHQIQVLLTDEFPYPLLLGRNAPPFTTLVQLAIQKAVNPMNDPEEGLSSGLHGPTPSNYLTTAVWSKDPTFAICGRPLPCMTTK